MACSSGLNKFEAKAVISDFRPASLISQKSVPKSRFLPAPSSEGAFALTNSFDGLKARTGFGAGLRFIEQILRIPWE